MVKPSLRTRSIGTKVTEEEYHELEHTAQAGGKTMGEWFREVILARVNRHALKGQPAELETQALMAEFVALRTILLNVLYRQANGEMLTADQMPYGTRSVVARSKHIPPLVVPPALRIFPAQPSWDM